MSSNLMSTEAGGEQTQYEGAATGIAEHKKSGGQFGDTETTTDPSQTQEHADAASARGERTAENIRYGQTISEGGMGGVTTEQEGGAAQEGYGRQGTEQESESDGSRARIAGGYGGESDVSKEVGG